MVEAKTPGFVIFVDKHRQQRIPVEGLHIVIF